MGADGRRDRGRVRRAGSGDEPIRARRVDAACRSGRCRASPSSCVVVGVSALSGGLIGITGPIEHGTLGGEDASASADLSSGFAQSGPPPTPFAVDAGNVAYVRGGSQGSVYRSATIREVCPAGGGPECAPIEEPAPKKLAMMAAPRTIISSPSSGHAVAVGHDTAAGRPGRRRGPAGRHGDALPDRHAHPRAERQRKCAGDHGTDDVHGTARVGRCKRADPHAHVDRRGVGRGLPVGVRSISPSPTIAAGLAIASGMTVVGNSAAFSPDGDWFAFTARPVGGGRGPGCLRLASR